MLFKKYLGLCVAVMFDIGSALIIAYFFPSFGLPYLWVVITSIIIVLLPDTDIIFKFKVFQNWQIDSSHREYFTHQPLIMVCIGLIIGLVGGFHLHLSWFFIFFIPILWFAHLIHDSIGCNGSLALFAPVKKTHFWITTEATSGIASHRIVIKKERSPVVPLDEWLKNYYYLTVESFFSWVIFVIGCIMTIVKLI